MTHAPDTSSYKKAIKALKDSLIKDESDLAQAMYKDGQITYREKQDMVSSFGKEIRKAKDITEICMALDRCGYDDPQDIVITHLLLAFENLSKTHTNGK